MKTITVARYLLDRLHELGLMHLFGVPGDFNLLFLDQVIDYPNIKWVGNCNELNAAYSADGYARVKGIGALLTTFGVGELSAINGVAGSFAEHVPVVKIVGAPTLTVQAAKKPIHHTFADGRFDYFANIYTPLTAAQAFLTQDNAAEEIDRVLRICYLEKKPVYISVPSDICTAEITTPSVPLYLDPLPSDKNAIKQALIHIKQKINTSKKIVVVIDYLAGRFGMIPDIEKLLEKNQFVFATTGIAKSMLSEDHPAFIGIYAGDFSSEGVKQHVETADLILYFGRRDNDFNTGGFTTVLKSNQVVEVNPNNIKIDQIIYSHVKSSEFIPAITKILHERSDQVTQLTRQKNKTFSAQAINLTQKRLWECIENFLKTASYHVIAEAGTAMFGTMHLHFAKETSYVAQMLWSSIGYSFGSCLGAALALPSSKRVLLLTGDGSFQLTAQEISTLGCLHTQPIIILINNEGYTVERAINGPTQPYNDIPVWNYEQFVLSLAPQAKVFKAHTELEFAMALQQAHDHHQDLCFIEVFTNKMDMPPVMKKLGEALSKQNMKTQI